jgi:hypothetical protein
MEVTRTMAHSNMLIPIRVLQNLDSVWNISFQEPYCEHEQIKSKKNKRKVPKCNIVVGPMLLSTMAL